ncbi:anhydro-N-acetylmuramic acid kinase [Micromonospora sp. NPDC049679]|uniref:anhydro-N-acetylmuramic acid kinase n=1 Tax=Micromonospora sp. NPDC049679 TaxID=3155920 RepID=UPI0033E88667
MRIIGLMSGTSHDGVDIAAAAFDRDGDDLRLTPLGARSLPYDDELQGAIAGVLPPGGTTIEQVCRLDTLLGKRFADAAAAGVELAGHADLIVSHGQTVFHWISGGQALGTLQLGAPAWIAARTGVPVLSDLRGADIAAGGQGAPLVPVFDALLLAESGAARAALNLGGIANLTVVAPDAAPVGYDIGPANALLDAATRRFYDEPCDVDGRHAARGRVHEDLLRLLLAEPFYARPAPKSTGKELFHGGYLTARLAELHPAPPPDDVLATLTELTALIVAAECDRHDIGEVIAAGGGVRNPVLMARLREFGGARWRLRTSDELGVPVQAKEAYAFALLGWLSWHGLPGALPSVTGARAAAVLGSWTPGAAPLRLPPPAVTPPRRLRVRA